LHGCPGPLLGPSWTPGLLLSQTGWSQTTKHTVISLRKMWRKDRGKQALRDELQSAHRTHAKGEPCWGAVWREARGPVYDSHLPSEADSGHSAGIFWQPPQMAA
ncbi:unnamed protein product, partial [Gulo gulo]